MTTRYRVDYALSSHRRDQFIEWIKGLLAANFVLHSDPTVTVNDNPTIARMTETARKRYADTMLDIERLLLNHIHTSQNVSGAPRSKLKMLVPTIGKFFTPLALKDAFLYQDSKRYISTRRFVAPSFNDVRLILNTAQAMSIIRPPASGLELVTFDGDVTLYDDGACLLPQNPVISRILSLMARGIRVGIVTAAGYTEAEKYYARLFGLLDAVAAAPNLTPEQRQNIVVMGGEANFLFRYSVTAQCHLEAVPIDEWALEEMRGWSTADIKEILDAAESELRDCVKALGLQASVIRKDRAVGIAPVRPGQRFPRESLEETVLSTQKRLEGTAAAKRVPFCAFNGGNDVFVDIGDKSWGVLVCQKYFSHAAAEAVGGSEAIEQGMRRSIEGSSTLHVGDQFLSAGANDFKARLACTTAWIASPAETVALLDEINELYAQHRGQGAGEGQGGIS